MNPDAAVSLYNQGRVAYDELRYSDAIPLLRAAILQREHYKAYEILGMSLMAEGNVANALEALERAYELNMRSSKTAVVLATCLLDAGMQSRCQDILRHVLTVNPTYGPARKLLEACKR